MFVAISRRAKLREELRSLKQDILREIQQVVRYVSKSRGVASEDIAPADLASGALTLYLYALTCAYGPSGCDADIVSLVNEIVSDRSIVDLSGFRRVEIKHSHLGDLHGYLERTSSYLSGSSSVLGTTLDDRKSAAWLVAQTLSAASGAADKSSLTFLIQGGLLLGLLRLNLPERARSIQALRC